MKFLAKKMRTEFWKKKVLTKFKPYIDSRHSAEARGRIQRKTWCMGPYAGFYYNLTLQYVDSNTCNMGNSMQERPLPYAEVDFIHQSENENLASGG